MAGPLEEKHVVTAFLSHEGRILLLRRSDRVSTYRGRWAAVSGSIEEGRSPLEQAVVELSEETRLEGDDLALVAQGDPLRVEAPELGTAWVVHPFLFRVGRPDRIVLDWEHVASSWVGPADLEGLETVPGLAEALRRVWS